MSLRLLPKIPFVAIDNLILIFTKLSANFQIFFHSSSPSIRKDVWDLARQGNKILEIMFISDILIGTNYQIGRYNHRSNLKW